MLQRSQKWYQCANLDRMRERISKKQVLRPLAKKRGLDTWEKIVNFTKDERFPSRLSFGQFKGRHYQKSREDAGDVHLLDDRGRGGLSV